MKRSEIHRDKGDQIRDTDLPELLHAGFCIRDGMDRAGPDAAAECTQHAADPVCGIFRCGRDPADAAVPDKPETAVLPVDCTVSVTSKGTVCVL